MTRDVRVKEYIFPIGSITSNAAGSLSVFSDHTLNGTIQNVEWVAGNHAAAGSILLFASGIGNSGIGLAGQIMNISGISVNSVNYPSAQFVDLNGAVLSGLDSISPPVQHVINSPLRVVGSGLGDSKSGLALIVRYI